MADSVHPMWQSMAAELGFDYDDEKDMCRAIERDAAVLVFRCIGSFVDRHPWWTPREVLFFCLRLAFVRHCKVVPSAMARCRAVPKWVRMYERLVLEPARQFLASRTLVADRVLSRERELEDDLLL